MLPIGVDLDDCIPLSMKKGEFVIFYERTLHGSAANTSPKSRPAINCRVTLGSTIVYPQRLKGKYIDGSNVDISKHACLKLSGVEHHSDNSYILSNSILI